MTDSFDLLKKARTGEKFEPIETRGERFKKNIRKKIKESDIRKRRDRSFYLEPGSIKPKNIMKTEKSLEKLRNDPRFKMEKRASGGRVGLKSGMRVCKLAKRGKGRAYGKNS